MPSFKETKPLVKQVEAMSVRLSVVAQYQLLNNGVGFLFSLVWEEKMDRKFRVAAV
jgi:hypothetical protein